jgi:hypothetical protein
MEGRAADGARRDGDADEGTGLYLLFLVPALAVFTIGIEPQLQRLGIGSALGMLLCVGVAVAAAVAASLRTFSARCLAGLAVVVGALLAGLGVVSENLDLSRGLLARTERFLPAHPLIPAAVLVLGVGVFVGGIRTPPLRIAVRVLALCIAGILAGVGMVSALPGSLLVSGTSWTAQDRREARGSGASGLVVGDDYGCVIPEGWEAMPGSEQTMDLLVLQSDDHRVRITTVRHAQERRADAETAAGALLSEVLSGMDGESYILTEIDGVPGGRKLLWIGDGGEAKHVMIVPRGKTVHVLTATGSREALAEHRAGIEEFASGLNGGH